MARGQCSAMALGCRTGSFRPEIVKSECWTVLRGQLSTQHSCSVLRLSVPWGPFPMICLKAHLPRWKGGGGWIATPTNHTQTGGGEVGVTHSRRGLLGLVPQSSLNRACKVVSWFAGWSGSWGVPWPQLRDEAHKPGDGGEVIEQEQLAVLFK